MSRTLAEARGRRAERTARWWLRFKGYRILAVRARCARGEVDIVARRGRVVAFVEVKHRATHGAAAAVLNAAGLRRVVAAAEVLAPRYARPGDSLRIDAVLLAPGRLPRHHVNIWHG
jgi:putative endonuclease